MIPLSLFLYLHVFLSLLLSCAHCWPFAVGRSLLNLHQRRFFHKISTAQKAETTGKMGQSGSPDLAVTCNLGFAPLDLMTITMKMYSICHPFMHKCNSSDQNYDLLLHLSISLLHLSIYTYLSLFSLSLACYSRIAVMVEAPKILAGGG